MLLKVLVLVDMPSMFATVLIGVLLLPVIGATHIGSFVGSYIAALLELLVASCQWLAVGFAVATRLESRAWGAALLRKVNKHFLIVITLLMLLTVMSVPLVNHRSRALGFRHGAISFH